jgi:hypothetical protein
MKQWEKKELVRGLRKRGLSYKEILQSIPFRLAKSTISSWCKDIELTEEQRLRLSAKYDVQHRGAKANQVKRQKEIAKIKRDAKLEISPLTKEEFKIAGLMLYWAEGNKTYHVGFSNSDPKQVKFMVKWFNEVCQVPFREMKAYLNIHSGQDENRIKQFWSNVTGIPLSRFGKSYIKKEGTGHRKNILYNGTIKISIYNSNLRHKILGWIEAIRMPA